MTSYKTELTGTTPFVNYQFRVKANNQQGAGEWSMTHGDLGPSPDVQFNYNKAEGGNPQTGNTDPAYPGADIVENYLGTGQKWAVHTFKPQTADKTFVVKSNPKEWRVLIVAGGGGSGSGKDGGSGSGGGAAGHAYDYSGLSLDVKSYPLSVGAGGALAPGTGYNQPSIGSAGGTSAFPDVGSAGGGAGGGNSGQGGHNNWGGVYRPPATPGTPINSDLTGTSRPYSQSEGNSSPGSGAAAQSKPGKDGLVIVAYQVG